jgi:hypothetical protein
VDVVGVSGRLCVLMGEMGCFEFWSFNIGTDVMRVYTVGADGHEFSCLCGLFFFAFYDGLTGRVLTCCSLLVRFLLMVLFLDNNKSEKRNQKLVTLINTIMNQNYLQFKNQ